MLPDGFAVLELRPGHADGAGDQLPVEVFVISDIHDHKGRILLVGFQPLGGSQETGVGILFAGTAADRRGRRPVDAEQQNRGNRHITNQFVGFHVFSVLSIISYDLQHKILRVTLL
jgi:hypothetical protein